MKTIRVYETEEKKNQICSHLFPLLVGLPGLAGGRRNRLSAVG